VDISPSPKAPQDINIVLRKPKTTKTETLTFSAVHRADLLTFTQVHSPSPSLAA